MTNGHKVNDTKKAIFNMLESLDVSINYCRDQTTHNLSGRHNALQAKTHVSMNHLIMINNVYVYFLRLYIKH